MNFALIDYENINHLPDEIQNKKYEKIYVFFGPNDKNLNFDISILRKCKKINLEIIYINKIANQNVDIHIGLYIGLILKSYEKSTIDLYSNDKGSFLELVENIKIMFVNNKINFFCNGKVQNTIKTTEQKSQPKSQISQTQQDPKIRGNFDRIVKVINETAIGTLPQYKKTLINWKKIEDFDMDYKYLQGLINKGLLTVESDGKLNWNK